jgi:hypothetical protein
MGVRITIDNLVPAGVPPGGIVVKYRIKGQAGLFEPPTFFALPIVIDTPHPAGTLYDVFIQRDCGDIPWSVQYQTETPCECATGYSPSPEVTHCEKTESTAPTVVNSGFCLQVSKNGAYGEQESRMYGPSFNDDDIALPAGTPVGGDIVWRSTLAGQWANPTNNVNIGPMNRCSVWIDSDCNGSLNSLSAGQKTTLAHSFVNSGTTRTIYVGIGADNMWKLYVNGVAVASCGQTGSSTQGSTLPFKVWHIIPITIVPGQNYINAVAEGDGSVNDAIGMVIYDNTASQIQAATSDASLNIIFTTATLAGGSYDVTTCPATYSLDTSGGSGNYICRRVVTKVCNSADI